LSDYDINPDLIRLACDESRAIRNAQQAGIADRDIGSSMLIMGICLILAEEGWDGVVAVLEKRLKDAKYGRCMPDIPDTVH